MLCEQGWPAYDSTSAAEEETEFVLQVDGKVRDRLRLPADTPETVVRRVALQSTRVQAHLRDGQVAKVVFVPNKLLNLVSKG